MDQKGSRKQVNPGPISSVENLWCKRCSKVATLACMEDETDEHPLVNLKAALRPQLQQQLQQLGIQQLCEDLHQHLESLASDCSTDIDLMQTIIQLLRDPSACDFVLRLQGGKQIVSASLQLEKAASLEERVAKVLALILTRAGILQKDKVEGKPHVDDGEQAFKELDLIHGDTTMDLGECSLLPNSLQACARRAAIIDRILQQGVCQLTKVYAYHDPTWILEVLERAAPSVVELELLGASKQHLVALQSMPRLRRLYLTISADEEEEEFEVPALSDQRAGLKWLKVCGMKPPHREMLLSLIRAHGRTLEQLYLYVGTPTSEEEKPWPESYTGLYADLVKCNLCALQLLVLERSSPYHSTKANCRAQLNAVRNVLPKVEVRCTECDCLHWAEF